MSNIKPKIVDGVKYWNIINDKKATFTDSKGKVWTGKQAFNRKFESVLKEVFNNETTRLGRPLTKPEISALRNHKDLGVWVIDGVPASVDRIKSFLGQSKGRTKTTSLALKIPKTKNKYFTRDFLESKEFRDTQLKSWYARLDKEGWPPGTSKKGFIKYFNDSANAVKDYNKILSKRLGFDFDAGHLWGAMGPIGDRTTIGPYGNLSGGVFTFRNVTSQPTRPTLKQLTSAPWNIVTANVPGFFDERGVQVTGAQELLEIGAGGQGWKGAFTDYLLHNNPKIDNDLINKLDYWDKAYIAFGDPSRGKFIGNTAEIRLAQLLEPGGKDKILLGAKALASTAVEESGEVTKLIKGSRKWHEAWDQILKKGSKTNINFKTAIRNTALLAGGTVAAAETLLPRRSSAYMLHDKILGPLYDQDIEDTHSWGDIGKEYLEKDLTPLVGAAFTLKAGSHIAKQVIPKTVAKYGAGALFPGPGYVPLAIGLLDAGDDILFRGKTKQIIKEGLDKTVENEQKETNTFSQTSGSYLGQYAPF